MDVTGSLQIQRITKCADQVVLVWVSTSWSFLEESRDPSTHCNSTDSFAKQCNYRVNCQVELEQVREEQRANNCDRHRAFVFVTCLNGKNFLSTHCTIVLVNFILLSRLNIEMYSLETLCILLHVSFFLQYLLHSFRF